MAPSHSRPAIHAQMKKLQVLTHPDKGGNPGAFHIIQVEYQLLTAWLKQYKLQVSALPSVWKDEYVCHCLKCSVFSKRRGQCEACMGMAKKGHKAPCSLAAGSFQVRKAYPKILARVPQDDGTWYLSTRCQEGSRHGYKVSRNGLRPFHGRTGARCQFICNRYIFLSPYICTSPPPPPEKV